MRSFALLALTLLLTACGDGESLLPPDARLPDGGRYRGELVDGFLQGQGRVDYPNGSWYAGQFDKGQWHGTGEWHGSNRSEEHTSELQSLMRISYAVFCLKKKHKNKPRQH